MRQSPTHALALSALVLAVACDAPPAEVPLDPPGLDAAAPEPPTPRPPDGLLGDAELQALVDAQHAQDIAELVGALNSERPAVRARAAFALASLDAPSALAGLVRLLSDPEAAVRRDASFALGRMRARDAVDDLAAALAAETDSEVRAELVDALGMLGTRDAADALLEADLAGAELARRAWALSRIGGVEGVEHEGLRDRLIEDLTHPDAGVREGSAYFFRTPKSARQWVSRSLFLRGALDQYEKHDPAAMHLLRALGNVNDVLNASRIREWAMEGRDWRIRADAVRGMDPMSASGPFLLQALDDPAPNVAVAAAERLTQDALATFYFEPFTAWVAAHPDRLGVVGPLLAGLGQSDVPEPLLAWLDSIPPGDESRWSTGFAALSFTAGEGALRALAGALDDPSPRVVRSAMEGLLARWERSRPLADTHGLFFEIFAEALDNRLPDVVAAARDALRSPELSARLSDAGVSLPSRLPQGPPVAAPPPAVPATVDWEYLSTLGANPRLFLETTRGTIELRLAPEEAPLTVQTVALLVQAGAYDDVPWHRVVPNFIAQTGDIVSGDGFGEPGFTIPLERTHISFTRGVVGMTHRGESNTQDSQFMVTQTRALELDGDFTAFGWVSAGIEVVDRLELFHVILSARIVPG